MCRFRARRGGGTSQASTSIPFMSSTPYHSSLLTRGVQLLRQRRRLARSTGRASPVRVEASGHEQGISARTGNTVHCIENGFAAAGASVQLRTRQYFYINKVCPISSTVQPPPPSPPSVPSPPPFPLPLLPASSSCEPECNNHMISGGRSGTAEHSS